MDEETKDEQPTEGQSYEANREPNQLARELGKLGAAKGGRARASVLTKEERSDIARQAVRTRWAKEKGISIEEVGQVSELGQTEKQAKKEDSSIPTSLFQGVLEIGDAKIMTHVLNNGKRVIAQREVVGALTGNVKGDISRYLSAHNLKPYIDKDSILSQTLKFKIRGTQFMGNGFEATLLVDICDAYLRAREDDKLLSNQLPIAKQAEIITRACAKVGIIALIDEVTGFQKYRKERELQFKLQAFIAEEMSEWARMFKEEFWLELARLEGIRYSPRNRPLRWGKYVMMFVYDAIDPDVGDELRKKNPNPHFLKNHHMWLKQFGKDRVHDQLERVIAIMKVCRNMKEFKEKFGYVYKHTPLQMPLDEEWLLEPEMIET